MQENRIELIALLKVEFLLLLAAVGNLASILLYEPIKAAQFKEIFLGMNVTLPEATKYILEYSDLLGSWPIAWVIALAIPVTTGFFGVMILLKWGGAAYKAGTYPFARFQIVATGALFTMLLAVYGLSKLVSAALMLPMLKLVNAN